MPAVTAHILKIVRRPPSEKFCALVGGAVAHRKVTRTAADDAVRHTDAVCLFKGADHLKHAVAHAGAEVKHALAPVLQHIVDGGDVTPRKIDDVDVVTHTRAVGRVVIVAENTEVFKFADGGLRDVGHQIVGNALGVLADKSAFVSADGVKVAQQHRRPFGVCGAVVSEDLLAHILRPAVGVGAASRA